MLERLQKAIVGLNVLAERRSQDRLVRTFAVLGAKLLRLPQAEIDAAMAGMNSAEAAMAAETSEWISAEAVRAGQSGPFDTLDLRVWLALAERVGVPFVPARTVIELTQEEAEFGPGGVRMPDNAVTRDIRRRAATMDLPEPEPREDIDSMRARYEALEEKLSAAMDDVPEGWMVRYARCGSSELKALAGSGAIGHQVPEVKFGPDLEIGPGWVRLGNRRRVNISDNRTVTAMAQGPEGAHAFLARPWVEAARYAVGEDPHRHGTQFAGKGVWPMEWRAFAQNGVVTGVACYYAWCGEATPENARIAMEVRALAQKIVDEAAALSAWPRFLDLEMLRRSASDEVRARPDVSYALENWPADAVSCTLDFLEAAEGGLTLLEGGPAHTPFGGGHSCAFAGSGGQPKMGYVPNVEGVAFRLMPGVLLADMSTWHESDRTDAILTWDEVAELAERPDAAPAP